MYLLFLSEAPFRYLDYDTTGSSVSCYLLFFLQFLFQFWLYFSTVIKKLCIWVMKYTRDHSYYRPQRSCGQGNIFTPVCHSVHRGRGFCLNACWDTTLPGADTSPWSSHPPGTDTPLGADTTPQEQTPPPGAANPPPPPGADTPPREQTSAYGLRAAGTHPTGMHSCSY